MSTDRFVSNLVLDAAMMPDLSPREKALRDLFVHEYFYDHNPYTAALRCGFMRAFASEYAEKFMMEPYVQQQIRQREEIETIVDDADAKKKIMAKLWKIATSPGVKHSAQVAALKQLSIMHGTDSPMKIENKHEVSNIQFYLPSNGRDTQALPTESK